MWVKKYHEGGNMKPGKRIWTWFLGVALIGILSGCNDEITGASPDPDVVIEKAPGESVSLQVTGPATNSIATVSGSVYFVHYAWQVSAFGDAISYDKDTSSLAYDYPIPESVQTSKIKITCNLVGRPPASDNRPILDSRTWTIRLDQGCTPPTWNGNYIIEDETDLNILKDYTHITGDLIITGSTLANLHGLENLTSVGGTLGIRENPNLTSLQGLNNLTSAGSIGIYDNNNLSSLDGLNGLTTITGSFMLRDNDALTSLGMDALARIGVGLYIHDNSSLCNAVAEELWDQLTSRDGVGLPLGPQYDYDTYSFIGDNKDCTP